MREHQAVRVGAGGVGLFALLALSVPRILAWIGWVEFAQGLEGVVTLFSDPRIHWTGIYTLVLILCAVTLCSEYWPAFLAYRRRKAESARRSWTMAADDVASYIAHGSYFSNGLKHGTKTVDAVDALMEAWMTGKVDVAGLLPGSMTLRRIRKGEIKGARLSYSRARGPHDDKVHSLKLVSRSDEKQTLFASMFCDRKQIAAMWPPKPDRI